MKLLSKIKNSAKDDFKSLVQIGEDVALLIQKRDFISLANRFDYALSYGRNKAKALESDFICCLNEAKFSSDITKKNIRVRYFKPNANALYALIECIVPVGENIAVLVELIVSDQDKHITIEQISCANCDTSFYSRIFKKLKFALQAGISALCIFFTPQSLHAQARDWNFMESDGGIAVGLPVHINGVWHYFCRCIESYTNHDKARHAKFGTCLQNTKSHYRRRKHFYHRSYGICKT